MHKGRLIVALFVVLFVSAVLIVGIGRTPKQTHVKASKPKLIDYACDAVWSKDSKALFYIRFQRYTRLYRYDIETGKTRSYNIYVAQYGFDVSPDKESILQFRNKKTSDNRYPIFVTNLRTGKEKAIYSSKNIVGPSCWLPQNRIIFAEYPTKLKKYGFIGEPIGTYMIDPDGTHKTTVARGISPFICACDGKGFLYETLKDGHSFYHFFNMTKQTRTLLDSKYLRSRHANILFLYVSSRFVIYEVFERMEPEEHVIELLDLSTMRSKRLPMLNTMGKSYISPNLRHYWTDQQKIGEMVPHPDTLYLLGLPSDFVQQLPNDGWSIWQ